MSVCYLKGGSAVAAVLLGVLAVANAMEYEFIRTEQEVKPDKIWDLSKLKIKKLKPGVYAFNGHAELFQPLDDKTKFSVKAYYSSDGSGKYQLMPHHLDPGNVCTFMNNDYKKYLSELYKVSDFPEIGNEIYCPLPKAVYKIKNYEFDGTKLPNSFKPGYYKVQMYFETGSGDKSTLNVYAKILN
ncbi:unnamed protein product [Hermetia illucens]|uniref:Uncharacterized protein n=1 Tax=Hermetia illucens TaxID=343691 RepID=A0A7R8UMD3_HERIL|nr:uncharacterized protein LOC119649792 [Hermetia illucens]CAD7083495.1 unnamed protein product [Hermetia illucens]